MRLTILGILLTSLVAGCFAVGGSLRSAADRLEDNAQRFYMEVSRDTSTGHESRDAGALAAAASDFSREVQRGTPRDELQDDFDRLAQRYHHVREQYADGGRLDPEERRRFDEVTHAYLELEATLKYAESRYHG
jgi:hypothetical protein